MTREQVRARRAELNARYEELNRQLRHVRVDRDHLYIECGHPGMKSYRDRTDTLCSYCDDCGYDR